MKELKKAQMGMIAILTVMLVSITRRLPTRKLSSGITMLALAGIVLLVAVGGASAADCNTAGNPTCACGDTVRGTAGGGLSDTYVVPADLTCGAGSWGLKVGDDNVIIDGNGKKLAGSMASHTCTGTQGNPDPCSGIVNYDFDNVVVKDLKITGFCTGIVMGDSTTPDVVNMTVTGCDIYECGQSGAVTHGIHLVRANDCTITKNEIHEIEGSGSSGGCGGGGNGIFGFGDDGPHGNYCDVTCNYLHNNNKSGAFIKKVCHHWTFANNNASANAQGGIVPMCKASDYTMVEYNIMTGNGAFGYQSQADHNTLRFNTITNNGQFGIVFKSDQWDSPAYGMNNEAYNNTVCGHTGLDIRQAGDDGGTNKADSNTCDTTGIAGACDWSCDTKVPVYYDYDGDAHYSAASCSCGNILGVGACCNPGLFNDTGASTHCDGSVCVLSAGDDPNDCDPGAPAEQPYYCDVDGDGYFSATPTGSAEELPPDCSWDVGDDCDDNNAAINPGAAENCTDGIDNDCDGLVDGEDPDCFPNKVYFMPDDIRVPKYCDTTNVSIWIDTEDVITSGIMEFYYTYCCMNVTGYTMNDTHWTSDSKMNIETPGMVRILITAKGDGVGPGLLHIGNITVHCCNETSYCFTGLNWQGDPDYLFNDAPAKIPVNWMDGTFRCNIPDLVVTMVKGTEIPSNPGNYTVNCTVKNIGDVGAGNSTVCLTVDGSSSSSIPPQLVPGLGSNVESDIISFGPIMLDGDADELLVCVDCNNEVVETDETNNCLPARYPGEVEISVLPATTYVQPQDQFDVKIHINPKGMEVYAVQYYLTYNRSVIRAETQTKDSFLGDTGTTIVLVNNIDQPHGEVAYAETRKDPPHSGGVIVEGNVTNIHFIAIGERGATTTLHIDRVIIGGPNGTAMGVDPIDGEVVITVNTPPVPISVSKHRINNVAQKYQSTAILCSCSYDPDYPGKGGNITYIRWAFGDGQYGTSEGLPDENNCTCKEHKYESWQWHPLGVPYNPDNPEAGGNYVPFDVQLDVTDDGCPELTNNSTFTINVYIAGDANGDGEVNILDAVWVGKNWRAGCEPCNPYPDDPLEYCGCGDCEGNYWNDDQYADGADGADLNNDCEINILDAVIVGANWRHTAW